MSLELRKAAGVSIGDFPTFSTIGSSYSDFTQSLCCHVAARKHGLHSGAHVHVRTDSCLLKTAPHAVQRRHETYLGNSAPSRLAAM